MNIWRINLKPGAQAGIDARKRCLEEGLVGIGWQVYCGDNQITSSYYEKKAREDYYNGKDKSWWPAWNALHNKMEVNDLIWTRDKDGIYYLGRIISDWFYDTSEEASRADMVNVRKCDWQKVGTIEAVPGKLVNCFIPARTLQMVHDNSVKNFSKITFNGLSNYPQYEVQSLVRGDIYSLLSSDDCEDALALYLQLEHGFMMLPSSCKDDTLAYEYELIHRSTGQNAVVQVKNGYNNLNKDDFANLEGYVYLFTTKGEVYGQDKSNIFRICPKEISSFLYRNINLMPKKIKSWLTLTLPIEATTLETSEAN
ncbi:hypothetical protein [Rufibacter sp. XAAS-G3-1]|uniref:hypothetical protein n=1 Tax=Rufibacter sp. XAAS-G3-1 TaxID=2729134 RepID=UPI0015E6D769|nr:hypothetical protein [Rufibacter sp. XAAS-G3-1]